MNVLKQYRAQNRRSLELHNRALASLPSGSTRSALYWPPHPLYLVSGSGSRVTDADGNTRIDLNYNNTTLIHGHNHPEIIKAAQEQLKNGTVLGAPTEPEIKLAEELAKVRRQPKDTVHTLRNRSQPADHPHRPSRHRQT